MRVLLILLLLISCQPNHYGMASSQGTLISYGKNIRTPCSKDTLYIELSNQKLDLQLIGIKKGSVSIEKLDEFMGKEVVIKYENARTVFPSCPIGRLWHINKINIDAPSQEKNYENIE